jgi:hypothetical protein
MNRFSTTEVERGALDEVHMQHLDEGTIHAWLDNALAGDEAASVAKHVDECRDCAGLVAEARGMIVAAGNIVAALDNVRGGVIPAPTPAPTPPRAVAGQASLWRRLHFTPTRAALAATLLIAVGSVLTVRHGAVDRRTRPASVMSDVAPAAPGPAVTTPPPMQAQAAAGVMKKAAPLAVGATVATPTAEPSRSQRRELLERAAKPSSNVADARQATDSARSMAADRLASAAAPSARANAPAVAGGAAPSAKASADSTRAAAPEQRRAQVMQLEGIVATGSTAAMRSFAALGGVECYQVRVDSASSAVTSGILPRFALARNSATTQNVVRSVTPEGHVDSIVPGGSWERLTPDVVRVRFATSHEVQPFTLQLNAGRLTGRAGTGDQATNLPVTRIDCRR